MRFSARDSGVEHSEIALASSFAGLRFGAEGEQYFFIRKGNLMSGSSRTINCGLYLFLDLNLRKQVFNDGGVEETHRMYSCLNLSRTDLVLRMEIGFFIWELTFMSEFSHHQLESLQFVLLDPNL